MTPRKMVTDSQAAEWREDLEKVATAPSQIPRQAVLSPEQVALALLADRECWKALAESYVEDPEDGVLLFYGGLQKEDGSDFTDEERDALLYSFLEWCDKHDLGYGGTFCSPPLPGDRKKRDALIAWAQSAASR